MNTESTNEVSIGKAFHAHAVKKSWSLAKTDQHVGNADDSDGVLEGKMNSLSVNEIFAG
jgi:hypothetical protein